MSTPLLIKKPPRSWIKMPLLYLVASGIYGALRFIERRTRHCLPSRLHRTNLKIAQCFLQQIRQADYINKRGHLIITLRQLDPFVFEEVLLLCFKERRYKVFHNRRYTGDGGIDGTVIAPDKRKLLVQAKRYANAINPAHVKDFLNVIQRERADGGYFIHTGRTGPLSRQARDHTITIISGDKLINLVLGLMQLDF